MGTNHAVGTVAKETYESSTSTSSQGPVVAASTHFGNFANYAHVGKGTQAQALASSYDPQIGLSI
jgi:hypothetical protein